MSNTIFLDMLTTTNHFRTLLDRNDEPIMI